MPTRLAFLALICAAAPLSGCDPELWLALANGAAQGATGQTGEAASGGVCAQYQRQNGTRASYTVDARVRSGTDLNTATRTYDYDPYSHYAVIFWSNDQATVIKMDYGSTIPASGVSGTDQEGRRWLLSRASYCG